MLKLIKRLLDYVYNQQYRDTKKKIGKFGQGSILIYPFYVEYPENLHVEDFVHIGPDSWFSCYNTIKIKRGTIVGPRLKIYTGNHNYDTNLSIPYDNITLAKEVLIAENVWIGGDVIILPGVEISEGCIVAGGSVVTKNFEPGSIIGGNPAKLLKTRDMEKYHKLKSEDKVYLKMKGEAVFSPIIKKV